jgi:tetraacyldisaccharide 4'-kinase
MSPFRLLLFPFCLLYGLVTWVRNKLFDWGILPSRNFSVPVISLGNLSTGGTGKTPHVEYLVNFLKKNYKVAVISRGYKRKTRGFMIVTPIKSASEVGDEPLQICRRHPDIVVAVHERRRKGIERILQMHPEISLIILDDAFQHRYVKPGLNLLLTEYYKPFFNNYILPCGNLREPKSNVKRAHALIVSKTPAVFSPLDRKYFLKKLEKYKLEHVFFSTIEYGKWVPLTADCHSEKPNLKTIFLYSGIANTSAIEEHLKRNCQELIVKRFPDHYQFSIKDLKVLRKEFRDTFGSSKAIVITEKDAMRLKEPELLRELKGLPVYYIPIKVVFHNQDKQGFEKLILGFLRANNLFGSTD